MNPFELTNEQIVERVKAWQDAGFVHPLTCVNSKHGNLNVVIEDNNVLLKCPKCKYTQSRIPPSILQITPEVLAQEKDRLIKLGAKF